jgi:hypothetical protein
MEPQPRNRRLLITLGVIAGTILIILAAWQLYMSQVYGAKLTVEAAPGAATITLNGRRVKAGTYAVRPGEMKVEASYGGFESKTVMVTAKKGKTTYAGMVLSPNTDATAKWYQENTNDGTLAEKINGRLYDQGGTDALTATPLIRLLPHIIADKTWRVDYGAGGDTDKSIIYVTSANASSKQAALNWVQTAAGKDFSTLSIIHLTNPLLPVLPHATLSWTLDNAGFTTDTNTPFLTLKAQILLTNADLADKQNAINRYKQQVVNYIRAHGADPANYNIEYDIDSN